MFQYGNSTACQAVEENIIRYGCDHVFTESQDIWWYHPDHLGSSSYLTDWFGQPSHYYDYLPFGEGAVEQNNSMYNNVYKFNAKQLDDETGYYYYGARYYEPKTSIWLSVDPLAEKYPNFSPYTYTFQNPLNFVDPTGMEGEGFDDDYFNKKGKYLGSDNANTDKVRIIDQETWDTNKTVNENGVETIEHNIGFNNSVAFSESDIQTEEQLKVYQYYNPTDLLLEADWTNKVAGASFYCDNYGDKHLNINTDANLKISDDANQIRSIFEHEKNHYEVYKKLGFEEFHKLSVNIKEQMAVRYQMNHPTFSKTSQSFQESIIRYGRNHGMIIDIKPKTSGIIIQKPKIKPVL